MKGKCIELYSSGLSLGDVSSRTKIPISTVRRIVLNAGILRGIKDAIHLAMAQGKFAKRKTRAGIPTSIEGRANISAAKREWASKNARGKSLKPSGYYDITTGPNAGRGEHRAIMEDHLGRPLLRSEVVHHKNHNRADNRIENLEVMTKSAHSSLHAIENLHKRKRDTEGRFL